jgi:hypothetical protein
VYFNVEVGPSKAYIFVKKADGAGKEELLAKGDPESNVGFYPEAESPDGRYLLMSISNESGSELATLDLQNAERPLPVVKLGISGKDGRFSPDGKWVVYNSLESGGSNVYVSSFGGSAGKWQLPIREGSGFMWVDDRIILWTPTTDRYEAVRVSLASGTPSFGPPEALFVRGKHVRDFIYAVLKDRKGYLGLRRVDSGSSGNLSIIVNWDKLTGSE